MSNSRDKANCPVSGCDVSSRMDKLKKHFQQSVLWDDNNSACHPSNPRYRISTKNIKVIQIMLEIITLEVMQFLVLKL